MLEEYGPEIVYIKGIHNTGADAVLWLEYDPSVNQTAESFHTVKVRNKQSHQRQNWMTVSKKLCKLNIHSDNINSYTDKMMIATSCLHIMKKRTKYTLLL